MGKKAEFTEGKTPKRGQKKSPEYKHFILTRFNTQVMPDGLLYDKPGADEWMDRRMPLFEETKKSVLDQDRDFEWVISLDQRTPDSFVEQIATDPRIRIVNCDIRDTFKEIEVDTPWVITSRLDCDDQYRPNFIKAIQAVFEPKLKVIDIRFHELRGRDVHQSPDRKAGSMFISLIEPADRVLTAFCRPHNKVATGYPLKGRWDTTWEQETNITYQIIELPLAYMVCHGENIVNRVSGPYLWTI